MDMMGGKILSYGVSGFALLMIGFTYYLMKTELKRELPRSIAIKTIWLFMGLVILSTIVVGVFSLPIANKNEVLNKEVNALTVDMSKLMGMLIKYEYALTNLAHKLDNVNKTNPKKPPRYNSKKPVLNTKIVTRHVDFSKVRIPKEYKISKAAELSNATRKQLHNAVNNKLNTTHLKLNKN